MKKLSKLVLHKAVKMTAPQMKHITGGYDGGCCPGCNCGGYGDLCGLGTEPYLCYVVWNGGASDTLGVCCGISVDDCKGIVQRLYGDYIAGNGVSCYLATS